MSNEELIKEISDFVLKEERISINNRSESIDVLGKKESMKADTAVVNSILNLLEEMEVGNENNCD